MKWDDSFYWKGYDLALRGKEDREIAAVLGVSLQVLSVWRSKRPALSQGIDRGRQLFKTQITGPKNIYEIKEQRAFKNPALSIKEHVFGRLPEELEEVWDRICQYESAGDPRDKLEALLAKQGKKAKQQLFLYALISSDFNADRACYMVGLPRSVVSEWKKDPEFAELVQGIEEVKGDLFESALIGKVREGDTPSIIFANKTFNKHRGYGEKVEIQNSGNITHNHLHVHIKIDELNLPLETRKQILQAIRAKKEAAAPLQLEDRTNPLPGPSSAPPRADTAGEGRDFRENMDGEVDESERGE